MATVLGVLVDRRGGSDQQDMLRPTVAFLLAKADTASHSKVAAWTRVDLVRKKAEDVREAVSRSVEDMACYSANSASEEVLVEHFDEARVWVLVWLLLVVELLASSQPEAVELQGLPSTQIPYLPSHPFRRVCSILGSDCAGHCFAILPSPLYVQRMEISTSRPGRSASEEELWGGCQAKYRRSTGHRAQMVWQAVLLSSSPLEDSLDSATSTLLS